MPIIYAHQLHIHKRPRITVAELRALLPWRAGDMAVIVVGKEVEIRPGAVASLTHNLSDVFLARSGAVPAWLVPELARVEWWDSHIWIGNKGRRVRPHFQCLNVW